MRLLNAHLCASRMFNASYSFSSFMVLIFGISCSASSGRMTGVFRFLVLERHRVDDALHIVSSAFVRRAFCEFLERAGLRDKAIE